MYRQLSQLVFPRIVLLLVLTQGLAGCNGSGSPGRPPSSPSTLPQAGSPPITSLRVFTEPASGFSTSDLRDAQEQIVQFNSASELIWAADGTRLPGYHVETYNFGSGPLYFVSGTICPEGCAFEVRFGSRNGERRAYLTADYGHDNPGTLVDVEVAGGALVVTRTDVFPPGTPALSGVVSELTSTGPAPIEGVTVYRGISTGWRGATTDKNGFYNIPGLVDGTDPVVVRREGYQETRRNVAINGDTRFDVELVR